MIKNIILIPFLTLVACNSVANTLYNTKGVNEFIENMVNKHDFDREELRVLFDNIKEEKKLKKFFKKAPERRLTWNGCKPSEKQCINYKGLFVTEHNIKNGKLFRDENYKILKKAENIFGVPKEIIVAIIGIETRYGKNLEIGRAHV